MSHHWRAGATSSASGFVGQWNRLANHGKNVEDSFLLLTRSQVSERLSPAATKNVIRSVYL